MNTCCSIIKILPLGTMAYDGLKNNNETSFCNSTLMPFCMCVELYNQN